MTDLPPPPPAYGGPVFNSPQPTYHLSGWWRRFGAVVLDGIIVGIPSGIVLSSMGGGIAGDALSDLLNIAIVALYSILMIGSRGQTVGKMATGIIVVRDGSPAPVGYGLAAGRYFAGFLSAIPCFLGYLWPLWDDKNQTFHDKICSTLVVRA